MVDLPVTTDVANTGRELWGYPKFGGHRLSLDAKQFHGKVLDRQSEK